MATSGMAPPVVSMKRRPGIGVPDELTTSPKARSPVGVTATPLIGVTPVVVMVVTAGAGVTILSAPVVVVEKVVMNALQRFDWWA
jgi:hypothetical protein